MRKRSNLGHTYTNMADLSQLSSALPMSHLFYEDGMTSMNDYLLTLRLDMSKVIKIKQTL